MSRTTLFFAAISTAALLFDPCAAQVGPTPPTETPVTTDQASSAAVDQIVKFGNYDAMKKNRATLGKGSKKPLAELLAQDKETATSLIKSLHLSCEVTDAIMLTEGNETSNGTKINSYEIACSNGMGYLAVKREAPGVSSAFSCFAAEATRQADIAAHLQPAPGCSLPANRDVKTITGTILTHAGKSCRIRDVKWLGQSAKTNTDYQEVACVEGNGLVIASPLPGSTAALTVLSCHEGAQQGVACKLPGNSEDNPLQTYKHILAQHKVPCNVADWRPIGTELVKKRKVVEFSCPQEQPKGLVAYIPLENNPSPFETIDCTIAAQRSMTCKLMATH